MARVKTGIPEFDRMLHGGFQVGDAVMVAGSAGTGKTTLALQYLVNGITNFGENGIYVSFEQLPDQIYRDAQSFGWDLRRLEDERRLRIVCTSPNLLLEDGGEGILDGPIREVQPSRIVIDSLSHLSMYIEEKDLRKEAYRLIMYLKARGLSSLLIWEAPQVIGQSLTLTEVGLSFLVDTIVLLRFVEIESSMKKALSVLKMRGSDHDKSLREYSITDKGVVLSLPFEEYEGVLTGAPRRAEQTATKLREWLAKQPSKLTEEYFDELCREALTVDGVRYCAVRDAFGNILSGGQKPGVPEIETAEERQTSDFRMSLLGGALANSPASFGDAEVTTLEFTNVTMAVYPLGNGRILLVTMEPSSSSRVKEAVKAIINRLRGKSRTV